jgi:nicotinic acid mononucleotide adenylyltransferase
MSYKEWLQSCVADDKIRLYVIATGAGAGIQEKLWRVPGASRYLVGASFPYAQEMTEKELGFKPEKFVSEETAIDLALEAYYRALPDSSDKRMPIGLGVTASVTSNREHKGEHRANFCTVTTTQIRTCSLWLSKPHYCDAEERAFDGQSVDLEALRFLRRVVDLNEIDPDATELAKKQFFKHPYFTPNGKRSALMTSDGTTLFPGAFNPPHVGHYSIVEEIHQNQEHSRPIFYICSDQPHKPALSVQEMLRRAKMLDDESVLFSENDPLYIDKARLRPYTKFIIGADALIRMLDPKWGPAIEPMLSEFLRLGTHFYVFGRECDDGSCPSNWVHAVDAIQQAGKFIHDDYTRRLFTPIDGRWNISSSQLRKATGNE